MSYDNFFFRFRIPNRGDTRRNKQPLKKRSHQFPLLPVRRSKREKRLIFANLTPREIDNTIVNRSTLMEESSEVSIISK